jgi:hypothetical protein
MNQVFWRTIRKAIRRIIRRIIKRRKRLPHKNM